MATPNLLRLQHAKIPLDFGGHYPPPGASNASLVGIGPGFLMFVQFSECSGLTFCEKNISDMGPRAQSGGWVGLFFLGGYSLRFSVTPSPYGSASGHSRPHWSCFGRSWQCSRGTSKAALVVGQMGNGARPGALPGCSRAARSAAACTPGTAGGAPACSS